MIPKICHSSLNLEKMLWSRMQVLELIHTGNWQLLAFVMKNTIMCSRDQFWYQQTVWLNNLFVNSTYNILVEWYFCLKICWQQHDSLHQCIYHVYTFINLCFYKMPKQSEHLTWLTNTDRNTALLLLIKIFYLKVAMLYSKRGKSRKCFTN